MIYPRPKPLSSYHAHEKTCLEQLPIMTYELGDLAKMLSYENRYKEDKRRSRIYNAESQIAMSDLLAQCVLMCERAGWDFWQLKKLGEQRFREKIDRHRQLGE